MHLFDFEKEVNPVILKRGEEYFDQQAVDDLEETFKGEWSATVHGNDDYSVQVKLNNRQRITHVHCDCPFEDGEICKHLTAVFFAIREAKTVIKAPSGEKTAKKQNATTGIKEMMEKISDRELRDFVRYFMEKDKKFKDDFLLYFADKDDSGDLSKKFQDLIRNTIKRNTSRGFIDYRSSRKMAAELTAFLTTLEEFIHKNNYRDALTLAQVMISETIKTIEYCDDSSGSVGEVISNAIELLAQAVEDVPFLLKEKVVGFLKKELNQKIYFDYGDFGYDLMNIYEKLSLETGQTQEFMSFLDEKIETEKNSRYDYELKSLIIRKISFLEKTDGDENIQRMINENLSIPEIRAIEIKKAVGKKEYEKAKKLITDGIKIADKENHSGTVYQWEKELLNIAELEKDVKTIRSLSKKFALERNFSEEYYRKWKATFTPEKSATEVEKAISEIQKKIERNAAKSKFYESGKYSALLYSLAPIYMEEQFYDRLLPLVKKVNNLDTCMRYLDVLGEIYPKEMTNLLLVALEHQAQYANSRPNYKDLVHAMKKIIHYIPQANFPIRNLAEKWKKEYIRRPAMVQELEKL